MNAAHWDELELLFEQAQALPPEERTAFLDAACRGDAALRDELDSLLRFSDNATHYFEALAGTVKSAAALVDQNQPRMGKDAMVGRKVAHYQVLTRLGGGGMGVVYKAWDLKLDRFVALKFLTPSLSADRDAKRRFIQEARAASALDHPNVAAIYDFNETAEGQLFIVMPFYAGETLKQKAARGAQPPAEVLAYAVQVARGLAKTHEAGIIHRDVKCANVLVTPQGEAKILDFGLAKLADQQLTKTGAAMGTIAYMAPEQARGEPIDPRADLWSLGVVLYELLTGKLPFRRAHEQGTLYAILNEQPQPLAALQGDIPLQLERIVARCLQKDPARRYPDAAALLADLERAREALAGGVRARRPFAPWQRWTWAARRPPRAVLGAAGVLAVLAVLLLTPVRRTWSEWLGKDSLPAEQLLAVLPFYNVNGEPGSQAFSDGLVETLTSKLTQLEPDEAALWVVPSSEVRDLRSVSEARKALGINLAVTGSVQQDSSSVRLTLNLIDAATQRQLNSVVLTEPRARLASLEGEVVRALAAMLRIELQPRARALLAAQGTTVPGAYDFYLQGLGYLQRYERQENITHAIRLFERAITEDPHYALAFAGLGEAYWRLYEASQDPQWVQQAVDRSEHALALDDRVVPAYATLGLIYAGTGRADEAVAPLRRALALEPANAAVLRSLALTYEHLGRYADAEAAYQDAIELQPGYWAGYNALGFFYYVQGRYADAAAQFRQVVSLTPDNARGYSNLGGAYFAQGRYAEARTALEQALEIEPDGHAYSNLGTIYFYHEARYAEAARMYEQAVAHEEKNYALWGNLAAAYTYGMPDAPERARSAYRRAIELAEVQQSVNPSDPTLLCDLASYHAALGEAGAARTLLDRALTPIPDNVDVRFCAGDTYERLGDRDAALLWIGRALEAGYAPALVERAPGLAALREDPRYPPLRDRHPVHID